MWRLALRPVPPRPGADELFHKAEPLIASADPADWDRAWDEYLEPLSRKYPGQYVDEVHALKERRAVRRELTKALEQSKRVTYSSEAERLYVRGLMVLKLGDRDGAMKEWEASVKRGEPGNRWAEFAREAIRESSK